MSDRIVAMRTALRDALVAIKCPPPSSVFPDWDHVVNQIGMFAYTGLEVRIHTYMSAHIRTRANNDSLQKYFQCFSSCFVYETLVVCDT
jgi:hypothetical protein